MHNAKIRYGLIGLGEVSEAHEKGYREILDKVEIHAVCDVNQDVATRRAAAYDAEVYKDYKELLDDPDVEAVDIMVPHYLHFEIAKAALQKNKHVLIEKPLAVKSREAMELCEIARDRGVKFTVAENTRFVKAYMEAEKLIKAGALGELRLIRTFIYGTEMIRIQDQANWIHNEVKSGGGAMMDMAAHTFYLIKWLFGEIDDVVANEWRLIPYIEVPDNATISGRLRNGAIYSTQYTMTVEVPWGERLEVYGSRGSIIIDQLNNPPAKFYQDRMDFDGKPLENVPYDPVEWKTSSMVAEVKDFAQAIRDDRSPAIDPLEAYYVIQAIEKAYESAEKGRSVYMASS